MILLFISTTQIIYSIHKYIVWLWAFSVALDTNFFYLFGFHSMLCVFESYTKWVEWRILLVRVCWLFQPKSDFSLPHHWKWKTIFFFTFLIHYAFLDGGKTKLINYIYRFIFSASPCFTNKSNALNITERKKSPLYERK